MVPRRLHRKSPGRTISPRQGITARDFLLGNPFVKKIDRWRVSLFGCVVDRRIFLAYAGLVILYGLLIVNELGWDIQPRFYISCPEDVQGGRCFNPCYRESGFCAPYAKEEYLPAGFSAGEKPPTALIDGYAVLAFIGFLVSIIINNIVVRSTK